MAEPLYPFQKAPRCTATSKRTGKRCGLAAERGKRVCNFHGARAGAPSGEKNGAYRHGYYTKEAIEKRRAFSALLSAARKQITALGR